MFGLNKLFGKLNPEKTAILTALSQYKSAVFPFGIASDWVGKIDKSDDGFEVHLNLPFVAKNALLDIEAELLEKTQGILNANFLVSQTRAADAFEREVQGTARAGFGYAGFDMSTGTPIAVLRENAREFDYEQKVAAFENSLKNMQIDDEQEGLQMAAELSRMEGGMAAASARAQGTSSMISGFGEAAQFGYEAGLFGEGK